MYVLYSLLLTLGLILLLPRFAIDALRSGKYVTGLRQRLGRIPEINRSGKPLIWLHCVSVGETQAAQALVSAIKDRFPAHLLAISTTTVTGQQVARERFGNEAAFVFYFPIDLAWIIRRVLRNLQPSAILIMETELWPRLLHECRAREIPVTLVNGRISSKSFGRYKLIRSFMRRVVNDLTLALMQSEGDATRIRELGLPDERITMPGNLKFDSAAAAIDDRVTEELRARFSLYGAKPLIVAASTHAPEERVVIEAFKMIDSQARLLIAPRHPERFAEVASLLHSSGLSWSRRSANPTESDGACDAVLLDSVGELRAVYPFAEIVFVGGSIAPHGGHNVLEPAAIGACVITGPHTGNFAAITKTMLDEGALIRLPEEPSSEAASQLRTVFADLLSNETKRREIGERAREVCRRNARAADRTIEVLGRILSAETAVTNPSLKLSSLQATTAK